MYVTTEAIVLSLEPVSDKAQVTHVYTRTGGRERYKVFGLGRRHAIGVYSPLSLVQLTTDKTSVRTAQLTYVPQTLMTDARKRAVALFISEVLYHTLRYPMTDERMFDFLANAVRALDETEEPQNFHLRFLIDFAAMLGFGMESSQQSAISRQLSAVGHPLTRKERQEALRTLCTYFEQHVETWQNPRSLEILIEVFD
ncbi:MAG: DNA repair protein RecO C-terminal domain-containing protein [Paludibacteraceae bacterium]|nr:DNA repair protein RecO C-terminal domain-containing protein [Paludibacteraceae bacterium]